MAASDSSLVVLGKFGAPFGVHGWIKIASDCEPRENIFSYSPWYMETKTGWQTLDPEETRKQHQTLIARLPGVADRDAAKAFTGKCIAVKREQLPPPDQDRYYWTDLIGLEVINQEQLVLGTVSSLIEAGDHDVLVIKGKKEILVPFVNGRFIKRVDIAQGVIEVDWDPSILTP